MPETSSAFLPDTLGDATAGQKPAAAPATADSTRMMAPTGNQSVDGLLDGSAWTASALSFGCPQSASAYPAGNSEAAQSFRPVSDAQHAVADFALTGQSAVPGYAGARLGSVASFTNEQFTDAGSAAATIMLGSSTLPATSYTYTPGPYGSAGEVWFGQAFDGKPSLDLRTPAPGNYAFYTLIHELGHALGLKHGNETGGVANVALPDATDSCEYSVMTYASYVGSPATGDTCAVDSNPQTYMMDDIAALQALYGANFSVVGPKTYSWDPNTGETFVNGVGQGRPGLPGDAASDRNKVFLTIWNGDGRDATYDFSNYATGVQVNLTPGQCSTTSAAQLADLGAGHAARGNIFNALQYGGDARSLIAGAVGGAGDDLLTGNAADNTLKGGLGHNTIDGGGGANTALYDVTRAQATVSQGSNGAITVSFAGGQDSLTDIQALKFSDQTLATADLPWLSYTDTAANTSGTVAMSAPSPGSPTYVQAQYINAGSAGLNVSTAAPNAFLRTGGGDDALQAGGGQNVLDGGLGSNFLTGGAGPNTFFTDARTPGAVWNTISDFHAGDAATLWGFTEGVSSYRWEAAPQGAAGFQGATLRADIAGGAGRTGDGIDASITFAGLSVEQAQRLQVATGAQPGGSYLCLFNPGM